MVPLGFVEKPVCKRMHRPGMALVGAVQLAEFLLPFHFSFLLTADVLCGPRVHFPVQPSVPLKALTAGILPAILPR